MPFGMLSGVGPRKGMLDWAVHWRHLANMTEPSMCVWWRRSLCQITLTCWNLFGYCTPGHVTLSVGRPPGPTWKRQPGHPCVDRSAPPQQHIPEVGRYCPENHFLVSTKSISTNIHFFDQINDWFYNQINDWINCFKTCIFQYSKVMFLLAGTKNRGKCFLLP